MDAANLFETPATYRHLRLEFALGFAASLVLFIIHFDDIRWPVALLLFAYSDLVGYIPGAIADRRSGGKRLPKSYYVLYNVGHSALTGALVGAGWALLVQPEWALLAIPIHLFGDRALFGNLMKPFSVPFEPEPHPVYERVSSLLALAPHLLDERYRLDLGAGDHESRTAGGEDVEAERVATSAVQAVPRAERR